MIKIDKKTLAEFQEAGIKKIHVYFYEAGCSGTKVDIESEFEENGLIETPHPSPLLRGEGIEQNSSSPQGEGAGGGGFKIYINPKDKEKFDGAMITRTVTADHTGQEKVRYIFSNPKIKDRCGCGTSFSFEKKVPKIDLNKLKLLRERFGK